VRTPRKAYLEALVATLDPARDLLVAGLGANARYLPHLRPRVPYLALCDAMGAALPLGLGMALARPEQEIVALEGDGSLLMNLGTLATIAGSRAPNFTAVVFDNGAYESSGGQALPPVPVDFVAVARGAGMPVAERLDDARAFAEALRRARRQGPALLAVATAFDPHEAIPPYTERPDEIRINFLRDLAAQRAR